MGNLDPHPSNLARPAGMMGVGTLTCVSFSVHTGVQEYSIGFILLATFSFFLPVLQHFLLWIFALKFGK